MESFVVEEDFARIASWGFNSVRLPVDGEWLFREEGRGSLDPEAFRFIVKVLGWAKKTGLLVILDVHSVPWHSFARRELTDLRDRPEILRAFCGQWKRLAEKLKGWDAPLWYDVLNEPVFNDPSDWNPIAKALVESIREVESQRTLVLEATKWGSIPLMIPLVQGVAGTDLVYSFHFYEPMFVTHQHARWWREGKPYVENVDYPGPIPRVEEYLANPDLVAETRELLIPHAGKRWDKKALRELLEPLQGLMKAGARVYCGEFGVNDLAPQATRLNWTRDAVELMDEMGIGWSYWNYRGLDFGVWTGSVSGAKDRLLDNLLDVLRKGS